MKQFIETLDLTDITLFCQDWGSLIGLRVALKTNIDLLALPSVTVACRPATRRCRKPSLSGALLPGSAPGFRSARSSRNRRSLTSRMTSLQLTTRPSRLQDTKLELAHFLCWYQRPRTTRRGDAIAPHGRSLMNGKSRFLRCSVTATRLLVVVRHPGRKQCPGQKIANT